MKKEKWLVCGTRKKGYFDLVFETLRRRYWDRKSLQPKGSDWEILIIEGCCPDSADAYAEEWAKRNNIEVLHHPSTSGNYLNRNIEMVKKADLVIAFWDGYSYGTAQTIAQATMGKIPIIVIDIKDKKEDLKNEILEKP